MAVVPKDDSLVIVDRCEMPPGQCIATMSHDDPKGFVDTLLTPPLVDPRVYLSVSYIEEVARKLGMEYPKSKEQVDEVSVLKEQLAEAERQLQAIDVMESAGYVARKKAGRPKKTTTKAKA